MRKSAYVITQTDLVYVYRKREEQSDEGQFLLMLNLPYIHANERRIMRLSW